jgi:hypothetical protein
MRQLANISSWNNTIDIEDIVVKFCIYNLDYIISIQKYFGLKSKTAIETSHKDLHVYYSDTSLQLIIFITPY